MEEKQAMTFSEFKAKLVETHGKNIRFAEVGQYGWTTLEQLPEKLLTGQAGPHWCEASPIPRTGRLLGKYNFITATAEFY